MSYKLILLSDLKPSDLNMVLRPHVAVDIIRELHLQHTQIWDLDWHNDHADFMSSPADKYARVIEKLLLGHVVLLQWPQARFDGIFDHSGNVHISMTMGIGNELLTSKVRTLQEAIVEQENHSPAAESKPLSKAIITPAQTRVAAPGRTIKDAAVAGPFEVEVELLDETETPIANAEYILKLATGEERTGQLDGNGYKLFSGAEYKRSQIHFPQYEGYDWERGISAKNSTPPSLDKQSNVLSPDPVEEIIPVAALEGVTVLDVEPINFDIELKTVSKYPIADAEFVIEFVDGSSQQGRLDEKGFHHLENIPEGEITITYSDYDDIFIKSLAAQIREAFDTRSNNTVFRILSKSSEIVQKIVEVYDQYYNDHHGNGLVNDILDEFTIPSYRLAVIGLLVAGGVDVGGGESYYPVESTKNTLLAIKPQPAISSIIKESSFNLRILRQQSVMESTDSHATYKWFVIHDEQAVMKDGASPITFLDDEFEVDYEASYYGQHIIMCCYQYHPGDGSVHPTEYYSYPINVSNVHSILAPDVEAAEIIMQQPDVALIAQQRYIDTLKQVATNTNMDDKATDKHEEELEQLEDNAERLEELIKSSADKRRYPIKAVAITTETSVKQPLKVFVYQKRVDDNWFSDNDHIWGLVDWTYCGNTAFCGEYEGTGISAQEAISNALKDWEINSQIAESHIGYEIEIFENNQILNLTGEFKTDGESSLDSVIKWTGYTALGAVGVALLFAPIPGSRVASAAIWSSIATSTTASVLSIYQRHDKGFSNLKDDGLDTLAIVGNIFGAGWMRQASMQFTGAKQGLKAGKYLLFGQIGTDGVSGAILTVDAMIQIDEIKSSSSLTPSEKTRQISELIRSLALVAAMTTLSLKGSKNDLAYLNAGKPDIIVENPKLKLNSKSSDKVHQGEVETKVVERGEGSHLSGSRNKIKPSMYPRSPQPKSIDESIARLKTARKSIEKNGFIAKYTDDDLVKLAKSGNVSGERFHVRVMESSYLEYEGKPGLLGSPIQGETGFGAKYWSTTFDQLEDADNDPKLISAKVGIPYDPDTELSLILIDTHKSVKIADTKVLVPTHENLARFTREELPDSFTPAQVDLFYTEKFQQQYSDHYDGALKSGLMKDEWDTKNALRYFNKEIDDKDLVDLLEARLKMQSKIGNNQHFLGNGLTKTLLPNNGKFGVVETFNFERKLVPLDQFDDSVYIIKDIAEIN